MKFLDSSGAQRRPKIGLVIDTEEWAFANVARQVVKANSDLYDFTVVPIAAEPNVFRMFMLLQDMDLIHFFWRGELWVMNLDYYHYFAARIGFTHQEFVDRYVRPKIISTAVYDHLYLEEPEISQFAAVTRDLVAGYCVSSPRLSDIYSARTDFPKPSAILPDGVDLSMFKPKNLERLKTVGSREMVVGWVGNSKWAAEKEDFKGFHSILKPAIDELQSEGFKIKLDTADRQNGFIPHSAMPDYYSRIDVYVCTSKIEGTPNPALESFACGIPVISTDCGLIPQLFGPKQKPFILEDRSVACLKEKLKLLLAKPKLLPVLSKENLESIKPWDWAIRARHFRDYFDDLLAGKRHPEPRPFLDGSV